MPKGIFGHRGQQAICHPDRPNKAKGLCGSCASKTYYEKYYKGMPEAKRKSRRLSVYGITLEQYQSTLEKQNYKCAICFSEKPRQGKSIYFCVDHNHKTGEFRGLLCGPCNRGIGYLKDNEEIIQQAVEYIKKG